MARYNTAHVPQICIAGIEDAFKVWEEMTGDWLQSAPEYLVTTHIAHRLRKAIPASQRLIWLEPGVKNVLRDAGGVQSGPPRTVLRTKGRCDIVVCHADTRPRSIIEVKNGVWHPAGKAQLADLHRICSALLHGKDNTQLYNGVLAIYTSSRPPKISRDATAKDKLIRKWNTEWNKKLKAWDWAGPQADSYRNRLRINVLTKVHEVDLDSNGSKHAWAAVCVCIARNKKTKQ